MKKGGKRLRNMSMILSGKKFLVCIVWIVTVQCSVSTIP